MMIRFSNEQLKNVSLSQIEKRKLCPSYLEARDRVWQTKLASAQATGQHLWNGELYTVEHCSQSEGESLLLKLGTCEYKDIIFYKENGIEYTLKEYGINHLFNWITVICIPITQDKKFVFGIRAYQAQKQNPLLGLIGGTVNKDERLINQFEDFTEFMKYEIEEETYIQIDKAALKLFSLNHFQTKYELLYTFKLPQTSSELSTLCRPGELAELVTLDLPEALTAECRELDAFSYTKNYLPDLLALADS